MIVARFEYRLTLRFSPGDLIKLEVLPKPGRAILKRADLAF
jgi:hypothetical protein